ncbi:MAG: lipoprotein [Ancalomicrobiaceae bacterium]|nr:lipoprotein [Ancalomicrobiaceae bacterium]
MTRRQLPTRGPIAATALVILCAALVGCGRSGPPELPGESVEAKPIGNDILPGANLPTKPETQTVKKKAKGNFILDPLL